MQLVNTVCDPCHSVGTEAASAETVIISINRKTIEVDLCEQHVHHLHASVEDFFAVGRRPGNVAIAIPPRGRREGTYDCDHCPRIFDSLQGLGTHRSRTHGVYSPSNEAVRKRKLAESERLGTPLSSASDALPEDMTEEQAEQLVDQGICPFDEDHGPYDKRVNLGTHLRKQHGVSFSSLGLRLPTGAPAHLHNR